jgi:two-component sensor histidine kinase
VEWSRSPERQLLFHWLETGGPPVTPPKRRGFGTRVIERLVKGLKGDVRFDWRTDGLMCELQIPEVALTGS